MSDDSPELERIVASTHKWTFRVPEIRAAVEEHLEGRVLNLFAGDSRLNHNGEIVRNDINPDIDGDYHFDATEVAGQFPPQSFDTVVLDPPFSIRNAILRYEDYNVGKWKLVADGVQEIARPGGVVITLGHNSTGLGKTRGFAKEKLYIFNHKGGHHDTFCLVERQMNRTLEEPTQAAADGGFALDAEGRGGGRK